MKGNEGAFTKFGIGRENPTADRMKRFKAIGSQTVGTTYHLVRVNTYKVRMVNRWTSTLFLSYLKEVATK